MEFRASFSGFGRLAGNEEKLIYFAVTIFFFFFIIRVQQLRFDDYYLFSGDRHDMIHLL